MDGDPLGERRRSSGGQDGSEATGLRCDGTGCGQFQKSAPRDASHGFPCHCGVLDAYSVATCVRWPLSFWKEVCGQYQCKWRAPNSIVGPVAGYVNSHILKRKDP
jgi:hypothetical protein